MLSVPSGQHSLFCYGRLLLMKLLVTRYDSTSGGEREIQRTMLELLNQLDGFDTRGDVKVIMATNRIESLDPALIRPGRIDRKIEFPLPDVKTKRHIFRLHTSRMSLAPDVDLEEYVMAKDDLSGADIKAVCTEAGLLALRERRMRVNKTDFTSAREKVSKILPLVCIHLSFALHRFYIARMKERPRVCTCSSLHMSLNSVMASFKSELLIPFPFAAPPTGWKVRQIKRLIFPLSPLRVQEHFIRTSSDRLRFRDIYQLVSDSILVISFPFHSDQERPLLRGGCL